MTGSPPHAPAHKPNFRHIDCLRGYAILMVIATHTSFRIPDLPWRFKQLVASGWHGVQLFFLASTLTLLMSAEWEVSRRGTVNWLHFYVRRFLRIAPAYYLAACVYSALGWNPQATATGTVGFLAFATAWIPDSAGQDLVPGAWSVSVEFTMYLLFPLIATYCRGVVRAAGLLVGTIAAAYALNAWTLASLAERLTPVQLENYAYFSFWNQLPVFALANLFYDLAYRPQAIDRVERGDDSPTVIWSLVVSMAMLAAAAYLPLPRLFDANRVLPPNFFYSACWMCLFIYGMAGRRQTWLTNDWVGRMGTVSFSAYLWHWLAIEVLSDSSWGQLLTRQTRWNALAAYALLAAAVTFTTFFVARLTYRFVEQPGIELSRRVIRRWRDSRSAAPMAERESASAGAVAGLAGAGESTS